MLASEARQITSNSRILESLFGEIRKTAEKGKDSIESNLSPVVIECLRKKGYTVREKPDPENERYPFIISW